MSLFCLNFKFCFKQDLGMNKMLVFLLSFVFNRNWSFTFRGQHENMKIACRCVWKQHENRLTDFKSLIIFLKIKRSIESAIGVLSQIFCLFLPSRDHLDHNDVLRKIAADCLRSMQLFMLRRKSQTKLPFPNFFKISVAQKSGGSR